MSSFYSSICMFVVRCNAYLWDSHSSHQYFKGTFDFRAIICYNLSYCTISAIYLFPEKLGQCVGIVLPNSTSFGTSCKVITCCYNEMKASRRWHIHNINEDLFKYCCWSGYGRRNFYSLQVSYLALMAR